MKLSTWLQEWLNSSVKPLVKTSTYSKYCDISRLHLIPKLGHYEINEITIEVIQSYIATLCETYAPNTVNGIVNVLISALKRAEKIGYIDYHFTDRIQKPKIREKKVECFSKDEQRKIEHYILSSGKTKLFGIILSLYSGVRIGELLALTWNDIDLDEGILYITKSCRDAWQNGEYKKCFDTPKTINSERIIPIPKQIISILKKIKLNNKSNYIVSNSTTGVSIRSYQRSFELLLKKLSIRHRGFHSLRHTFATRALECGMDVRTLAELLGHKNPTITLKRYAHSLFDYKSLMMNKLGKMLD